MVTSDSGVPPEELFRVVFADTHFPLLSADTVALAAFLANPRAAEGCHLILDFPSVQPDRRSAVLNAFRGLISRIDPEDHFIALLCGSPPVRNTPAALAGIEALFGPGDKPYLIRQIGPTALRWDETSPWPAAYRHFLGHLRTLVEGYALLALVRYAVFTGFRFRCNSICKIGYPPEAFFDAGQFLGYRFRRSTPL
jgi:hypothetical protein